MKKITIKSFWAAIIALVASVGVSSCSEDLGPTIFPDVDESLDQSVYTFPLDTFIKVNYNEPYNISFLYRMQDISSDMNYNLIPCSYEKSIDFAVLCKYLWYDVYKELAGDGDDFVKTYSPRIIHLIGSPAINPQTGTIKLGEAEGGKKITLYRGNDMNITDVDVLNEFYFKTMHHEFGHILHQNHLYPQDFKLLSNGQYNPQDWQNMPDSVALGRGFISPYSSNMVADDWVEMFANYIVKDDATWNQMMETSKYDWEKTEGLSADTVKNCLANGVTRDIIGYITSTVSSANDGEDASYTVQRKVISRDDAGHPILSDGTVIFLGIAPKDTLRDENGEIVYNGKDKDGNPKPVTSERDNLGWTTRSMADSSYVDVTDKLVFTHVTGRIGRELIQQKWDMVNTWLKEYFKLDFVALHKEVQRRQYVTKTDAQGNDLLDEEGNYIFEKDARGRYINRLTWKDSDGQTFIEKLRNEVNKYEDLQKK